MDTLAKLDVTALAQHQQANAKVAKRTRTRIVRDAAAELLAKLRAGQ